MEVSELLKHNNDGLTGIEGVRWLLVDASAFSFPLLLELLEEQRLLLLVLVVDPLVTECLLPLSHGVADVLTCFHILLSTRLCVRRIFFFYFSTMQKSKKYVAKKIFLGGPTTKFPFFGWNNGRIIRVCLNSTQILTYFSNSYNMRTEKIRKYLSREKLTYKIRAV